MHFVSKHEMLLVQAVFEDMSTVIQKLLNHEQLCH